MVISPSLTTVLPTSTARKLLARQIPGKVGGTTREPVSWAIGFNLHDSRLQVAIPRASDLNMRSMTMSMG